MNLMKKCIAIEVFILFWFWFWMYAGQGFDAIATAASFWISTAFVVWMNRTIQYGFKP